jgi:hypothetical protein
MCKGIQQIINESLLAEQEKRKDRQRSGKFSPSMLGRCYRAQIWNRANVEQTEAPDVRTLRVFKVGHIFHEFVQGYFDKAQTEVKVESEHLFGYADLVLDDTVIDIKSQHSRAFWYMEKTNYDIKKEKYPNILQVMTYAYLLKKPKGRLIFISKDDLCCAEYEFALDQWKDEIFKEMAQLKTWWKLYQDNETLPPAEPRCYNGKECQYCNWKTKCKELENGNAS